MRFSLLPIAPLILMTACASAPPKPPVASTPVGYACDFLPDRPAPAWVQDESPVQGYYLGKGGAGTATSVEAQKQAARASALKSLAESIKVSVNTQTASQTSVKHAGGNEDVAKEVVEITRIGSNLTLQKVEDAGEWLDRKSCTYWARVRLSESALRFERLRELLAEVRDPARALPERREALESAEALLKQIDFTRIPDAEGAEYYATQISREKDAIGAQKSENLAVVWTDGKLPPAIAADLLAALPGGQNFKLAELDCRQTEICVNLARRHGARHLLMARISQVETSGKMGGRSGKLNLEITLTDIRSGKTLWGPIKASESLVTFAEFSEQDWREAAQKAAAAEAFRNPLACLADQKPKTCS